jgi:hypothetical protein
MDEEVNGGCNPALKVGLPVLQQLHLLGESQAAGFVWSQVKEFGEYRVVDPLLEPHAEVLQSLKWKVVQTRLARQPPTDEQVVHCMPEFVEQAMDVLEIDAACS